jgi:SPP1 family predicted phage head-tail adaptor
MTFASTLKHKVSIQSKTADSDAEGQAVENWAEIAAPYADIRHLSGLETVKGGAVTSAVKVSIRIRYRPGLDAGMRVVHGTDVYNIQAVLPDKVRWVYVDLACEVVK